jgi:uncharacterized protein (TIGR03437 family)
MLKNPRAAPIPHARRFLSRFLLAFVHSVGIVTAAQNGVIFSFDSGASATVRAMTVDSRGFIYLTGSTTSGSFPTTPGSVQPKSGGDCMVSTGFIGLLPEFNPDVFVMKLDAAGNIVFATYLGGTGPDTGTSIAVDPIGYVYIAGSASPAKCGGNGFPTTAGAVFPQPGPGTNGFVAKLSPGGDQLVYSTYLPGAQANALALDRLGNVYVAGTVVVSSSNPLITSNAFQTTLPNAPPVTAGLSTGFVVKLNADGSALIYGTYLGGASSARSDNAANGIDVDAVGNAYITGTTTSGQFPVTAGTFQTQLPSPQSGFVAELNSVGSSLVYSTYLGGTDGTQSAGSVIHVDTQGNAYVLGSTSSANFPVVKGAFQSTGPNAPWAAEGTLPLLSGGFLTKVNPQGSTLLYSTYLSGARSFALDGAGNAYVEGAAYDGFPVTRGASQPCTSGTILMSLQPDSFAIKFAPDGKVVGATYVQGPQSAIALDRNGSVYYGGSSVARIQIDDAQKVNRPCMSPGVQNGASFVLGGQRIAAGEIVTLRGTGFGPDLAAYGTVGGDGRATTKLASVQVFFDDISAPILYAQSTQINTIVPWEIVDRSSTQIHVEYNGIATNSVAISVVPAVPSIFFEDLGSGLAAALNEDGSLNAPSNPAKRGTVVSLFGTGGGVMSPAGVTGGFWPANPLSRIALSVEIQICGGRAPVLYAGSAPGLISGVFQINFRVPDDRQPTQPQSTSACGGLFVIVDSASYVSGDIYVQF